MLLLDQKTRIDSVRGKWTAPAASDGPSRLHCFARRYLAALLRTLAMWAA
jgi:hypothetical protein